MDNAVLGMAIASMSGFSNGFLSDGSNTAVTGESFGDVLSSVSLKNPADVVNSQPVKDMLAEMYGVATFYSQFKLNPEGKVAIAVCLGTACYVKGSGQIADKITEIIGIAPGETSPDGKYSFEATRCIGACGLAPVLTINGEVYGRLTVADIAGILKKYE